MISTQFILDFFFSKLSYTLQIPDSKRYPNTRKASIPNAHLLIKSGKMESVD